jgi:hypothetical protein
MQAIIETREDNCTGDIGIALESTPNFEEYPSIAAGGDARIIAHDLVEHINIIGSVSNEHEALGALWYIRGQHCDLQRPMVSIFTPEDNLAHDISREYAEAVHIEDWTQTALDKIKFKEDDQWESLKYIRKYAKKHIKDNAKYEDYEYNKLHVKKYLDRAMASMVIGIRKARKRYGGSWNGNRLFWNITYAVEPHCHDFMDGQKFLLKYCIKTGEASCNKIEYYE